MPPPIEEKLELAAMVLLLPPMMDAPPVPALTEF